MLRLVVSNMPAWYIGIAVILSLYYGIRGVVGQRIAAQGLNLTLEKAGGRAWSRWEVIFVRYVQDFIFSTVCSVAGFLALFLSYFLFDRAPSIVTLSAGHAILITAGFAIGIVGITGQLPYLLLEGKLPKVS